MNHHHSDKKTQGSSIFRPPLLDIIKNRKSSETPTIDSVGSHECTASNRNADADDQHQPTPTPAAQKDSRLSDRHPNAKDRGVGTLSSRFMPLLWGLCIGACAVIILSSTSGHPFLPLSAVKGPSSPAQTMVAEDKDVDTPSEAGSGQDVALADDQEPGRFVKSPMSNSVQATAVTPQNGSSPSSVTDGTFNYIETSADETHSSTLGLIVDALSDL